LVPFCSVFRSEGHCAMSPAHTTYTLTALGTERKAQIITVFMTCRATLRNNSIATAIGRVIQPAHRAYASVARFAVPVAQASIVFLACRTFTSPDVARNGTGTTAVGQRTG